MAGVAMSLSLTMPARAAMQVLHGHVPAAVSHLSPLGQLPGTNHLNLAIGLPLRNREVLTNLLQQIYDPSSTNYHRYLTPARFTEQFGPTEQDYQAVIAFAKGHGLTVTATHPNRLVLDVNGAVTDVEKAFQLALRLYRHPTENRNFFAPDVDPSVPSTLSILSISGLNNYSLPHPCLVKKPASQAMNAVPASGTGPGGNYWGNDFRNAYAPGVTLNGSGQSVALVEFDSYYSSDIATYISQAGLQSVPLQNVYVNGSSFSPGANNSEVALDIEVVNAMAPGLSKIIVYQATNGTPWISMLSRIADDDLASQISASWGGGNNNPDPASDAIFLQMAAQGQSYFNSAGDSDAYTGDIPFPSDNPYITIVGGTTLTTGSGAAYLSETVWNWGNEYGSIEDGVGGSGGISTYYSIPTWQRGVSMSANQGSTSMRNIPDVALTANHVWIIADNGQSGWVGGTSVAAPLWAAFASLVNQYAVSVGQPAVGFINPAIYAIGKGANYTSCFHDTMTGNNTWSDSPSKFYAVYGYDLCTGWGTPNGQNLIDALVPICNPDGILQASVTPANASVLLEGTSQTIYVQVTDGLPVTNATVVASVAGVTTNLVFVNNGVAPDVTANDDIYTTNLYVPASTNNLTLTFHITAPGKTGSTNVIVYCVAPIPGNNNFTNAIKVPAGGAAYLSNNRFATTESGEPHHDGDVNAGASLWWSWTPTVNTNVLIDTTGSAINLVLAVYTGSALTNLQSVIATNNTGTGNSAWLTFNAASNTTYQIAVASAYTNSVGSLRFRLAPGGQPDTNAPVVFITSPTNGLGTTNFLITVSGTANDPEPNASGISQVFITLNDTCTYVATGTTNWSDTFGLAPGLNNISVFAEDFAGNISASASIQVVYIVQNPPNDFFANAVALTGNQGQVIATNTAATKELGEPDHAGNVGGKSLWWSFSTNVDGVLTLSTSNSTFDTLLGLYTGPNVANLTTIAANDDAYVGAPGGFSLINQAVKSGQQYYIAVDGFDGDSGTVVLNYSFVPATLHHLTIASSTGGTVQVSTVNSAGGTAMMAGTSGNFANNTTVTLTAYPNSYYTFNGWTTNGGNSSLNPLSFVMAADMNITGTFGQIAFSDGFESGDFTHLPWQVNVPGNATNWFVQTNIVCAGRYAARSGVITDSESSSLVLIGTFGAGTGSFDYLVSSEEYWDFLNFYVDGVLMQQWSGEVGWANFAFPLTAGTHTLEWSYVKDPSFSDGLDAAFIDDVNLPNYTPLPLTLGSYGRSNGMFWLTVTSPANSTIIQASTNLINWVPIYTNYTSSFTFTDSNTPSCRCRFYRAVSGP